MKFAPKKWHKYHIHRLFHTGIVCFYVFFFFLASMQLLSVYQESDATYEQENISKSVNIGVSIPKIYVDQNLNDNLLSQSLFPPRPDGSNSSSQGKMILDNFPKLSPFRISRPIFSGKTDISKATIFITLRSKETLQAVVAADAKGMWFWQVPEDLNNGQYTIKLAAIDPLDNSNKQIVEDFFVIDSPNTQTNPNQTINYLNRSNNAEKLGTLFDVLVKIPPEAKTILPGNELFAEIRLVNFGQSQKPVDVNIEYIIENSAGLPIFQMGETVAVATQLAFLKNFHTNAEIVPGQYRLVVKVPSDNLVALAYDNFEISPAPALKQATAEKELEIPALAIQAILAILLLFGFVLYMEYNKISMLSRFIKNLDEKDLWSAN